MINYAGNLKKKEKKERKERKERKRKKIKGEKGEKKRKEEIKRKKDVEVFFWGKDVEVVFG